MQDRFLTKNRTKILLAVVIALLVLNLAVAQQSTQQTTVPATNVITTSIPRVDQHSQSFWPVSFKDWIDVFQGIAVIFASGVAFLGINSWRREFVGKRKMELAEEVLTLFYQAKDSLSFIRSPGYWTSESSGRPADPQETSAQKGIRDDAFVTRERFNKHSELFSRIHALRYRFMAQFGRDAGEPFAQLKAVLDKLVVALHQWVMLSNVDERTCSTPESLKAHRARIEKYDGVLWGVEGDDPILAQIDAAIHSIEEICRPHIDRKR